MDKSSLAFYPYTTLSPVMGNTLQMYSQPSSVYHNKILIVDPCNTFSDPQTLTGSHNWTSSAETKNDENMLIVHDDTIANIYCQSFKQNFLDLGGSLSPCAATGVNEASEDRIVIFPNPFNEATILRIMNSGELRVEDIKIYDLVGKKVHLDVIRNSDSFVIRSGNVSDGIYFLNTSIGGKHFTSKLIIQH